MKFETVLFDFDGTLANTLPLTIHGMQAVFEKYDQRILDGPGIIAMFGPTEDGMIADNFQHQHAINEAIQFYYTIYARDHQEYVGQNPQINNLLSELRKRDIVTGVITGKSRRAYALSENTLGFENLFDSVVTGDDVSKPKPNPEGILKTIKKFHANPETTIYIGDSNWDVMAGKAAGIHTAAVQWLEMAQSSEYPANPDYLWHDVDEMIRLLE